MYNYLITLLQSSKTKYSHKQSNPISFFSLNYQLQTRVPQKDLSEVRMIVIILKTRVVDKQPQGQHKNFTVFEVNEEQR